MKKNFLLIFILVASNVINAQNNIDVSHYQFHIELNDNNDSIFAEAIIRCAVLEKSNSINLDLRNESNGKGMSISTLKLINSDIVIANSNHSNNKLNIQFATAIKAGDSITLLVAYKGIPADGLIISKNKYGHRSFFADNWPNRGHNWLVCHDDPADKAMVDFIVTAPQHYQVVGNGIQIEETNISNTKKQTHWKEEVPISTKVMVIGVADFAVTLSGFVNDCIPVYSWVYPENRDSGFYDYAQANEILPWFIKNVGAYGYKKLANVQSKTIFGGLENANTIFYSENSVSGKRKSESLITHEIAHQWFGNMATEKSFAHLWLSEGFATYMTILYFENKYGIDTAKKMLIKDREEVILFAKENNSAIVNNTQNYMELLNANSYQKGSWVLHMLRQELGNAIFWESIQKYYATYAGKTADSDDLRKVFEKVSGKDLKLFFQQWVYSASLPSIQVKWKYLPTKKRIRITVNQIQQAKSFFFPLTIAFNFPQKPPQSIKIPVTKEAETFELPLSSAPESLQLDPEVALLLQGEITKEPK